MRVAITVFVNVDVENRVGISYDNLIEKVEEAASDEIDALEARMKQVATSVLAYGEDRSYMTE